MHPFVPAPCSYRESLTTGLPRIKGLDMPSTIIRFEQTLILTMAGRLCDPSLSCNGASPSLSIVSIPLTNRRRRCLLRHEIYIRLLVSGYPRVLVCGQRKASTLLLALMQSQSTDELARSCTWRERDGETHEPLHVTI